MLEWVAGNLVLEIEGVRDKAQRFSPGVFHTAAMTSHLATWSDTFLFFVQNPLNQKLLR